MKIIFKRNIKRSELAKRLHVSYDFLYKLEKGQAIPSLQIACKLAKIHKILKIEDGDDTYFLINTSLENNTIEDPIGLLKVQKEAEDIVNISKETLVQAFSQHNPDAQKIILKECQETYEALGEALWR